MKIKKKFSELSHCDMEVYRKQIESIQPANRLTGKPANRYSFMFFMRFMVNIADNLTLKI